MTLTRESLVLMTICIVDLLLTVFLLHTEQVIEGNPLMSFYLRYGMGTFIMVKLTLVVLPIFIAEWSKQYRPGFVRLMLRATIITYLSVYLLLFLSINVAGFITVKDYSASHYHANVGKQLQP